MGTGGPPLPCVSVALWSSEGDFDGTAGCRGSEAARVPCLPKDSPACGKSAHLLLLLPLALITQHENPANAAIVQEVQVQRGAMGTQVNSCHMLANNCSESKAALLASPDAGLRQESGMR